MRTRIHQLPKILQNIDTSKLDYIDDWAYAATEIKENCANVYFIAKDGRDFTLIRGKKSIRLHTHIVVSLPKKYATTHEDVFKTGIKSTARQLAFDRHFTQALDVIPTNFYVFDQDFMTKFSVEYEHNVRRSRYSDESKERFRKMLQDAKREQLETLNDYDLHLSKLNPWNQSLRREKTLV